MKTNKFHLAYYRENVEQEVLRFKDAKNDSITHWLHVIEKLDLSFLPKVDYIVRALSSNETTCVNTETPLDMVAKTIAKKTGAKYIKTVLSKKRTQQLKFAGNSYNRKGILDHAYHCDLKRFNINDSSSFLIIDDVSTTGTTFEEITRAIMQASSNRAKVTCFSLVKTLWNRDYTEKRKAFNDNFFKLLISA